MTQLTYRHMIPEDFLSLVTLSDDVFGKGYYTEESFVENWKSMTSSQQTASWVALNAGHLIGFRIVFLPGLWSSHLEFNKSLKEKWNVPLNRVAYFKTACVHLDFRRKGIGTKLAYAAINDLIALKAQAIVTHSWDESPNNSSNLYLKSFGFEDLGPRPLFWHEDSYDCDVCHSKPCICNATEMIFRIRNEDSL